ncbi:WD40 repeat domain-containing protein [Nitrincola sp. MINF-07-Sa-05]|uniref:WD40 repeat domain-containing protein n=1 Tax=Nitrincola salilacus TaxID=3400273 RepID=UPI0039182DFB
MKRLRLTLPFLLVLLAGCDGPKPEHWSNYTVQGAFDASLSHDGNYALVGSIAHGGSLWDTRTDERLYDWNHHQDEFTNISQSGFSPEGDYAITANPQDLVLWNVQSGEPVWFWSSPGEILDLSLSSNGDFALLGLANHEAVYFDVKNGGIVQSLRHPARVRSVALSQDNRFALTGSDDYTTRLWDLASGELLHQITLGNIVDTVALSPDNRMAFSSATLDQAILWDLQSGEILHHLSGNESLIKRRTTYLSARFASNSEQLLTGTAAGAVILWNTADGKQTKSWQAHKLKAYGPTSTGIYAVSFGRDGSYYALGSNGVLNAFR